MATIFGSTLSKPGAQLLTMVLAAAFVLKALLLFVVIPVMGDAFSGRYDIGFADSYDLLANNLVSGNGYRFYADMAETMMREPGYPLFLAGLFSTLGYHIEVARLANLLLAFGAVVMLVRVAQRLSEDQAVLATAALLFLFHPGILVAEARGGVEMLFIFTLMLFVLVLYTAVERGRRRDYFVAGLALGLATLVRSTPLLFPIFVLAYLVLFGHNMRERAGSVSNIVILTLGTAVAISPWVIRNYALTHEVVVTASVQGVAAQEGQYTCERMSFNEDFWRLQVEAFEVRNTMATALGVPFRQGYYQLFYTPRDELKFNKVLLKHVADRYSANPMLFGKCVARNLINFWLLAKTWTATGFNALVQLPFVALALAGAWMVWRQGLARNAVLMMILVGYFVCVHAPIIAHSRHSIPLVPFLGVFASIASVGIWRIVWRKKRALE